MSLTFDAETLEAARLLTKLSLQEDLHDRGDITSLSTIPEDLNASVNIASRQVGIVSGLPVLPLVFEELPGRSHGQFIVRTASLSNAAQYWRQSPAPFEVC